MMKIITSIFLKKNDSDSEPNSDLRDLYLKISNSIKTEYVSLDETLELKYWDNKNRRAKSNYFNSYQLNSSIDKFIQLIECFNNMDILYHEEEVSAIKKIVRYCVQFGDLSIIDETIDFPFYSPQVIGQYGPHPMCWKNPSYVLSELEEVGDLSINDFCHEFYKNFDFDIVYDRQNKKRVEIKIKYGSDNPVHLVLFSKVEKVEWNPKMKRFTPFAMEWSFMNEWLAEAGAFIDQIIINLYLRKLKIDLAFIRMQIETHRYPSTLKEMINYLSYQNNLLANNDCVMHFQKRMDFI